MFSDVQIQPIPFLEDLRSKVLSTAPRHKEKERMSWREKQRVGRLMRTPKNRLRLADDLGLQIQVKDHNGYLWECLAVMGDDLTADDFDEKKRKGKGRIVFGFNIKEGWIIRPCIATRGLEGTSLKARILDTLTPEFCRNQFVLFGDNCLNCGKALTDPISRQRLFGPECYGNGGSIAPLYLREEAANATS